MGSVLFAQAALLAADHLPRNAALDALERAMRPQVDRATRLYCVGDYPQTIPFYFKRSCMLVGYRGELDFGLTQEPRRGRARPVALCGALAAPSAMPSRSSRRRIMRLFQALGAPMRVIYTAPSLVAVSRR